MQLCQISAKAKITFDKVIKNTKHCGYKVQCFNLNQKGVIWRYLEIKMGCIDAKGQNFRSNLG